MLKKIQEKNPGSKEFEIKVTVYKDIQVMPQNWSIEEESQGLWYFCNKILSKLLQNNKTQLKSQYMDQN